MVDLNLMNVVQVTKSVAHLVQENFIVQQKKVDEKLFNSASFSIKIFFKIQ